MTNQIVTLPFPSELSIGTLLFRKIGMRRWQHYADACGLVPLVAKKQYRLVLNRRVDDEISILKKLDLDLLDEIEIPYPIAWEDLADSIAGDSWIPEFVAEQETKLKQTLKTRARIVFSIHRV